MIYATLLLSVFWQTEGVAKWKENPGWKSEMIARKG